MDIGLCTGLGGLTGPMDGLAYIEPTVAGLLCPAQGEGGFAVNRAAAEAEPVPPKAVNCFFPGDLKNTGPDVDPDALDAWVERCCRRSAAVGVETIVFGSGGSRAVPEGFDRDRASEQIVENLRRYGPIAARHGITLVLEPLARRHCNIVTTVDEGAERVRAAGHPNVLLLADTYHMAEDGDPPEAIRRAEGLIAHVHCAEGNGRGPLGATGEDQRPYFRALKDIGYDGRISLECRWDDLPAQLPGGIAELRTQWETA